MKNKSDFENFLETLRRTNKDLGSYVDSEKCIENTNKNDNVLKELNLLLGDGCTMDNINKLFDKDPGVFGTLKNLIALSKSEKVVLNASGNDVDIEYYFKSPEGIYEFISKSGLKEIFLKIKDLNDYVLGVEVGKDTHARKNRSGKIMEAELKGRFEQNKLNFKQQVKIEEFSELSTLFGSDTKQFDFVIYTTKKVYLIECNFYSARGSKPTETARSYQELASKIDTINNYDFVWITDGVGWLSAKNVLREAYQNIKMYNLFNINDFIQEVKNA